jgi:XTP/dITP diphosphohydrolase
MKTILFATGNKLKLGEARLGCGLFDIKVEQIKLDIDEIQSRDPLKISKNKAEKAYSLVKKPLVVTDSFWQFYGLNGFPGAYMKDVNFWFTSNDFLSLLKDKKDKRISLTESISYIDSKIFKVFSKEFWGKVVETPRGTGNAMENIAEFDGFTLGERRNQRGYSHKPEEYIWYDFAEWYSKK